MRTRMTFLWQKATGICHTLVITADGSMGSDIIPVETIMMMIEQSSVEDVDVVTLLLGDGRTAAITLSFLDYLLMQHKVVEVT